MGSLFESEFEVNDEERSNGTNETKTTDDENVDSIKDQLTRRETRAVFRLRVMVISVLVLAATGVSVTVLMVTRQAEIDEFKVQYEGAAQKVLDSFDGILQGMGSISGLAVSETAHSVDHNVSFPFVTMSNFQEKGGHARSLSQALYVSISMVVKEEQLPAWDEFVLGPESDWM